MISDNKQLRIYNKQGKFVRSSVDEVIAKKLNHWDGWYCSAGIRYLYIDYNRNIFMCNAASTNAVNVKWGKEWKQFLENQKEKLNRWKLTDGEINGFVNDWLKILQTDTDYSSDHGYVGTIGENINFPKEWNVCPFESCSCGADVIISKSKTKHDEVLLAVTKYGYDGQFRTIENRIENDVEPAAIEMDFPIPFQILWDITRRCNYDCSYCWSNAHNKTDKFIPIKDVIDICKKLIFEWAGGEEIRFNFGGGEPTLHPNFIEIIKYLKLNEQFILVTSNGSRNPTFWKEAVRYINSVNLSAHFESIDKEKFLEILTIILDWHDTHIDDHWIEVKLMAPPGKVYEAINFKHQIEQIGRLDKPGANKRTKGVCSLVPIRSLEDSGQLTNYSDEELQWFQNQ